MKNRSRDRNTSKKRMATTLVAMMVLVFSARCSSDILTPSTQASLAELVLVAQAESISVWATETDMQTAQDILVAVQAGSAHICAELQTSCEFPIKIEVYPNQASFDEHILNREMRGYFAISGGGQMIQMVSPANPAPHNIKYEDGVQVAVHEFIHLALDEVNPELPLWLDEGMAVYLGPHAPYTMVCQYAFPFEMTPSFRQLEHDYRGIPVPDLFAYTAVDFIVDEYGMEKLNTLLRRPKELEKVLEASTPDFEEDWQRFLRTRYRNYKSQVSSALEIICIARTAAVSIVTLRLVQRKRKGISPC